MDLESSFVLLSQHLNHVVEVQQIGHSVAVVCTTCHAQVIRYDDPAYQGPSVSEMQGSELFELDVAVHIAWWKYNEQISDMETPVIMFASRPLYGDDETLQTDLGTPGKTGLRFGELGPLHSAYHRAKSDYELHAQILWSQEIDTSGMRSEEAVRQALWEWYAREMPEELE